MSLHFSRASFLGSVGASLVLSHFRNVCVTVLLIGGAPLLLPEHVAASQGQRPARPSRGRPVSKFSPPFRLARSLPARRWHSVAVTPQRRRCGCATGSGRRRVACLLTTRSPGPTAAARGHWRGQQGHAPTLRSALVPPGESCPSHRDCQRHWRCRWQRRGRLLPDPLRRQRAASTARRGPRPRLH